MNPFVKAPQTAHWFTKYQSDDNNRLVWAKGEKAKVPGKGSLRCPLLEFDTVFSVWMHEAQLPIDLAATRFLSADNLKIQIQVQLTAKVKDSDAALIAVATRFENSMLLVQAEVTSILRGLCKSLTASSILSAETEFATALLTQLQTSTSKLPFEVLKAVLQMNVPLLETAPERNLESSISFEEIKTKEERETALAGLRNVRTLAELVAEMERKKIRIEAECAERSTSAHTDAEIKTANLANFEAYAKLTEQFQTGVLIQGHPAIFEKIEIAKTTVEIAKATHDVAQMKAAYQVAFDALSGAIKNAAPITGVFGNITPNK